MKYTLLALLTLMLVKFDTHGQIDSTIYQFSIGVEVISVDTFMFSQADALELQKEVKRSLPVLFVVSPDKVTTVRRDRYSRVHDLRLQTVLSYSPLVKSYWVEDLTNEEKTSILSETELIRAEDLVDTIFSLVTRREIITSSQMPGELAIDISKVPVPSSFLMNQVAFGRDRLPLRITSEVMGLKITLSIKDLVFQDIDDRLNPDISRFKCLDKSKKSKR